MRSWVKVARSLPEQGAPKFPEMLESELQTEELMRPKRPEPELQPELQAETEETIESEPHAEDAPVMEPTTYESEETHSGNEASGSVEDSPPMGGPEPEDIEEQEGSEPGDGSRPDEVDLSDGSGGAGGEETGESGSEPPPDGSDDVDSSEGSGSGGYSETEEAEEVEGSPSPDPQEPSEGTDDGSDASDEESQEQEPEEIPELKPRDATGVSRKKAGGRNTHSVFSLDDPHESERRVKRAVRKILARITRDRVTSLPGEDEWDEELLVTRKLTKSDPKECRCSIEEGHLVVILDTSGSCAAMAALFGAICQEFDRYGCVELYDAPNAKVSRKKVGGRWEYVGDGHYCGWKWPFSGEKIIFLGDFDGGDLIIDASEENQVVWLSCEGRYEDTTDHDWCSRPLSDFRGQYLEVVDATSLLKAARRIRM